MGTATILFKNMSKWGQPPFIITVGKWGQPPFIITVGKWGQPPFIITAKMSEN